MVAWWPQTQLQHVIVVAPTHAVVMYFTAAATMAKDKGGRYLEVRRTRDALCQGLESGGLGIKLVNAWEGQILMNFMIA